MEEAKAAAYYDELNRKGEGARRFKQGLGFSSSSDATSFPSKPAASSSFLSGFVRAGAAPAPAQAKAEPPKRPPRPLERPSTSRHRSCSPPPSRPRARSRSRSPSRSSRRRSRSRSLSRERRRRSRSRERDRRASRRRSRSRSRSPSRRSGRSSHSEGRRDRHGDRRHDDGSEKSRGGRDGGKVDYSRLIEGYDRMSKHEDKVRDAHEEAIFGVPTSSFVNTEATEDELKANDEEKAEDIEAQPSSSLISDKGFLERKSSEVAAGF
nr:unnamed protein product [Digitaria exilis]